MTPNELHNSCYNIVHCLSGVKYLLDREVLSTRVKIDWETNQLGQTFCTKMFKSLINHFIKKYPRVGWRMTRVPKYDSTIRNGQYIPTYEITTNRQFGAVKEDFVRLFADYTTNPTKFVGIDTSPSLFDVESLEELKTIYACYEAGVTSVFLMDNIIAEDSLSYTLPMLSSFSQIKDLYCVFSTFSKLYYNVNFMGNK